MTFIQHSAINKEMQLLAQFMNGMLYNWYTFEINKIDRDGGVCNEQGGPWGEKMVEAAPGSGRHRQRSVRVKGAESRHSGM